MKGKRILGLLLAGLLLGSTARAADITVTVEGSSVPAFVEEGVTYVQLTPFLEHLGGWETRWDHDAYTASAETDLFTLDVPVRRDYVLANAQRAYIRAPAQCGQPAGSRGGVRGLGQFRNGV